MAHFGRVNMLRKLCMPMRVKIWSLMGLVWLTACAGPMVTSHGGSKYPIDPILLARHSLEKIENIYREKLTAADLRGDIVEQRRLLRKVAFVQDMEDQGEELENTLSRLLSLYHDMQPVDTLALVGIHLWLADHFVDSERFDEAKRHVEVVLNLNPHIVDSRSFVMEDLYIRISIQNGDYSDAEKYLQYRLSLFAEILDEEHGQKRIFYRKMYESILGDLILVLELHQKYEDLPQLYVQYLELKRRKDQSGHPDDIYAKSVRLEYPVLLGRYARALQHTGDYGLADEIINEVGTILKSFKDDEKQDALDKIGFLEEEIISELYHREVRLVPYDAPPVPIGGYAAIQNNVVYPASFLVKGIGGKVIVQAFVNKSGRVSEMVILQGVTADINRAAAAAIRRTRFMPASARGRPVAVWISIPIHFGLR